MSYIDQKTLDELRSKADIADVIGNYLPLTKKGSNFVALCPFHDDSNPSLNINREKQIFKCFVCNAGGNVFSFVQRYEGISFVEAVSKIANLVGFSLNLDLSHQPKIDPQIKEMYDLVDEVLRFTRYQLKNDSNEALQAFLKARHLDANTANYFELGYNGGDNIMTNFLKQKNYPDELLVKVDVAKLVDERLRDTFFNRVLFPIHNDQGQVVAFSGRSIQADNAVKYINTANTPIYQKGDILYNYHRVLDPLLKAEAVILCEGVMDVIAFYKAGFKKVVASLGTALTKEQIQKLKGLRSEIILAYDGDKAGKTASYQIGKALIKENLKVSLMNNKSTFDPDDIIRKEGKEALVRMINEPQHWLEFVIDYGFTLFNLTAYEGRKDYAQFVLSHLVNIDPLDQATFLRKLSTISQFELEDLQAQIKTIHKQETTRIQAVKPTVKEKIDILNVEKEILVYLLNSKQFALYFRDNLGYLIHPQWTNLALMLVDMYNQTPQLDMASVLSLPLSSAQHEVLVSLIENELYDYEMTLDGLKAAIKQIEIIDLEGLLEQLEKKAHAEMLAEKKAQYTLQMIEIQHKIELLLEEEDDE